MRLHFRLRPVNDIAPWQPVPSPDARTPDWLRRPHLSWFALTLGWYWIEAGDAELFRYSQAAINVMVREQPDAPWALDMQKMPYDDYQVSRLWEDLLELLPDVLEPVPPQLAAFLGPDGPWAAWEREAEAAVKTVEDEIAYEKARDLLEAAARWWWNRHLSTAYLQAGPQIWFWSDGSNAHIQWDNRGSSLDDIPAWETLLGHHTIPVADFVEEVRSFDAQFMQQMRDRIENVQTEWTRPEIALDPGLAEEHHTRSRKMQQCMESIAQHPSTAWGEVFRAIAQIESLPTFPKGVQLLG